jgi:FG-GAP repeat
MWTNRHIRRCRHQGLDKGSRQDHAPGWLDALLQTLWFRREDATRIGGGGHWEFDGGRGVGGGRSQWRTLAIQAVVSRGPQVDFNGDDFDDLAIGVPNEDVGGQVNAGAVNILYGSAGGLTGTNQLLTQA